jgi:hypothetical protein
MYDNVLRAGMTLPYLNGLLDGCTGKPPDPQATEDKEYQAGYQQGHEYWLHVPSIHPLTKHIEKGEYKWEKWDKAD